MVDEVLVGPDAADQIERLDEHFARLRLVDGEGFEFRWTQAAPQAEVEAGPVRLSSIAASSATSSGFRNGRMLTMLANRRRRVLRDAAAIIKFGDGTRTAACQRMRLRPRCSDRQRVPPWPPDRSLSFLSEGPYRSSRPATDQRVFLHKLAIGHLAASKRQH
jgi:hypothetical protein